MTEHDDWTFATGWRKAVLQLVVRLPIAWAVCWFGFFVLRKIYEGLESETQQELDVSLWLIVGVGVVVGAAAALVLTRKLSDATGLIGNHLLAPACVPFIAGLWGLQQIVRAAFPEWIQISFYLFGVSGITGCAMAWWRFSVDS